MSFTTALWVTAIALVVFLAIDLTWLGLVAKGTYRHFLGPILLEKPRVGAAGLFYALFVIGLVYFAIAPAIDEHSLRTAMQNGALYGFFTYATFDLTCYSVLKGYPLGIVPIDMAWGTFLAFAVASSTYGAYQALT
ncbi:MAG: DUF2177 family protein [Thermoleophilia bacterium]|nr:DUF2177 family protein [Thermoleophilia bacterium]